MLKILTILRTRVFLHVFLCFCMPWFIIYVVISLYTRQFNGLYFIYFLFIAIAFFISGVLISFLSCKNIHFSISKICICIFFLCLVDQGIKIYIANNLDISLVIIRDWLAIEVLQNTYGSFIWSLFDKKLPGLFVLFALFSLYFLYRMLYFYQKDGNLFLCLLSFILMCSAFICVCIDKAFYGGTYDYIYLYQRVYFDIKDVYLASSIFTTLLSCIYDKSWSELKQSLRYDPWGKKYYKYEFDTWHSLMTKFTKRKRKFE